jgi:hypothetical protein
VIDYFPQNIPRILINRTVVHPAAAGASLDEESESDFRNKYVFDAYLLGFCDDITRALAKQMFKEKTTDAAAKKNSKANKTRTKKTQTKQRQQQEHRGRLLSTVLRGKDEDLNAEEWADVTVPPERVLLFPGALPSKDGVSEVKYQEIAHCDGCTKQIRGDIWKCINCFDFDLCQACFPKISKSHFGGKHSFTGCSQRRT